MYNVSNYNLHCVLTNGLTNKKISKLLQQSVVKNSKTGQIIINYFLETKFEVTNFENFKNLLSNYYSKCNAINVMVKG